MIVLRRETSSGGPPSLSTEKEFEQFSSVAGGSSMLNVVWPMTDVVVWLSRIIQPDGNGRDT
jgi:hypothetical protein